MRSATTIHDVARRAGVAPITVSRVVNNSGYVSGDVRQRVESAVAELGYVPNSLASSLRSRRTHTVALIVTDITNPFFTTVARGVEDAASDAGLMVIVCNSDEREDKEQTYLRMLLGRRVDGILLVPARGAKDSIRFIKKQKTPMVVLDRPVPREHVDVVRCDSENGAYQLGRLLVSLGHTTTALLSGPRNVSISVERAKGFRRAFSEARIGASRRVYHGEFTQESGYEMTRKALAVVPRPTALFAANNFIALGALRSLGDAGLRVPEDIALVGFDDLPPALVTFPFLTVAAQPAYEMGRKGVELLLDRLNGHPPKRFREVVLPTELIVRRSSGTAISFSKEKVNGNPKNRSQNQ